MSNSKLHKANANGFFNEFSETIPKSKRAKEQQVNDSLNNTMEYYKEDNSSRNNNLKDNKYISKTLTNQKVIINSKPKIDCPNSTLKIKSSFGNKNLGGLYDEIKFARTSPFFANNKEKNVEKRFEDEKQNNDYCLRCNSEIECTNKFCPHCLKPFCKKCIKEVFIRNLDNNVDQDNFEQKIIDTNKICPNCLNSITFNDVTKFNSISLNNFEFCKSYKKPLDGDGEANNNRMGLQKINEQKEFINKEFNDQNQEYDLILKKIEIKKKEIEIKKNLNMNLIQMLQKSIETEYNYNLNKLNEMVLKIQKIQDSIQNKINFINQKKNFNNAEMLNLVAKFQKVKNSISKNYEKLDQKIILKSKPKAYKVYETKPLKINFTETYYMKEKEIFSNQHIGNAYIKIERYVNNYTNCLNFSVLIKKDEKNCQNNNPNKNNSSLDNKSQIVIYMVINNKLIKLNKANKDNNKSSLNYDCSLEENFVFISKSQSTDMSRNIKKYDFDIKIIITELFL